MWLLRAERGDDDPIEERVHRQGTVYRRARQLFAAGYTITAVQFAADGSVDPVNVYRFDGIRFSRVPRGPQRR